MPSGRGRFSGDASVIGRTVYYKETPYTVIGVAARGFAGVEAEAAVDVWVPDIHGYPEERPDRSKLQCTTACWPVSVPARIRRRCRRFWMRVFRAHLESEILAPSSGLLPTGHRGPATPGRAAGQCGILGDGQKV